MDSATSPLDVSIQDFHCTDITDHIFMVVVEVLGLISEIFKLKSPYARGERKL